MRRLSMDASKRTYTQQEVTEILKRALRQERLGQEELSHEDLVAMAAEIGIDRNSLDTATAELAQTQASELARQTEARELATERALQLGKLTSSLMTLLSVCAAVFVVGRFLHRPIGFEGWEYWGLLIWAIVVFSRIRHVVFPHDALARRKRKEEKRALREARHARRQAFRDEIRHRLSGDYGREALGRGTREFETAVQAGVAALLSVAARKIHEHAERRGGGGPGTRG